MCYGAMLSHVYLDVSPMITGKSFAKERPNPYKSNFYQDLHSVSFCELNESCQNSETLGTLREPFHWL